MSSPSRSGGRLAAAHFGVFDYTAALGLPPHEQRLDHPACDHARHVMRTAFAGTGVELSDGSLAASPASGSAEDVYALWRRHAELVRHSLGHGFYQGWDMHPAHLVSRFATVYAFHLAHYESYCDRVRAWEERRAAGGGVMDEPATIKTLTAALHRADAALALRTETSRTEASRGGPGAGHGPLGGPGDQSRSTRLATGGRGAGRPARTSSPVRRADVERPDAVLQQRRHVDRPSPPPAMIIEPSPASPRLLSTGSPAARRRANPR